MKLKYRVIERINTFHKSKKEFAIDIKLDTEWWTYVSYEKNQQKRKYKKS
jgi:hypothetical protein